MSKVIVDHTGLTDGHYYKKDVPVELPANVIKALGDSATPFDGEAKAAPAKKEVKKVLNKMVQTVDATTKSDAEKAAEAKKAEDEKQAADPAAEAKAKEEADTAEKAKADADVK
ncbi:MAG TPA: hypothetical protein VE090_02495 [Methylomirabilota bacterium]|nr:hypothetical protein [Methylomirabilota bacterium]